MIITICTIVPCKLFYTFLQFFFKPGPSTFPSRDLPSVNKYCASSQTPELLLAKSGLPSCEHVLTSTPANVNTIVRTHWPPARADNNFSKRITKWLTQFSVTVISIEARPVISLGHLQMCPITCGSTYILLTKEKYIPFAAFARLIIRTHFWFWYRRNID